MAATRTKTRVVMEEGTLYDLERLQTRQNRVREEKETEAKEEKELTDLKKKVQLLKRKRNKLLQQKDNAHGIVIQQFIDTCMTDDAEGQAAVDALSSSRKEEVLKAAYSLRKRKLVDLCTVYRLTGLSIASQQSKQVCFRLDTFYQCQYHEPYYVEIASEPELKITKHTIPYFIPLTQIAEEHLHSDIQEFFSELGIYLNAMVSRREQVNQLKSEHNSSLVGEVSTSPAVDFIQFTLRVPNNESESDVTLKLSYQNLKRSLPNSIGHEVSGGEESLSTDFALKVDHLKTMSIPAAVTAMYKDS